MIAHLFVAALQSAAVTGPSSDASGVHRASIVTPIAAPAPEIYAAATGDISGWWNHTFAADPEALILDARPGGALVEYTDVNRLNGVVHAQVTAAQWPHTLRMEGPFGLAGHGVETEVTWIIRENAAGADFEVYLALSGDIDHATARTVVEVWRGFIEDRLKPYVEGDCHIVGAACAGFAP